MSKRTFALIIFFLTISARTPAQDDPASQTGQLMIGKAMSIGALGSADTPPMTVKAVISIAQSNAETAKGTYEMLWMSQRRWRQEVRFGNYSRIRVANAGGYWQSSSVPFRPYFMSELDKMVDVSDMVGAEKHASFGKVQERQVSNTHARCIQAKPSSNEPGTRYCFDSVTGSLIQVDFPKPEFAPPQLVDRVEYDDIRQKGDKLIPFRVQIFRQDKVFMTFQIAEIGAAPADPAAVSSLPPNSAFWPACNPSRHFELQNRVQPQYPEGARQNHESGRVLLYGVIEGDGTVSNLQVIVSATPRLDAAAMDAVRHWRYKPMTCDVPATPLDSPGAPGAVRMETSIEVVFALRH
ncbi:MAG: TonB family protein [Acidobacteria bacterium]|nr:TonB family protein [Acidobacteriota bacterium]